MFRTKKKMREMMRRRVMNKSLPSQKRSQQNSLFVVLHGMIADAEERVHAIDPRECILVEAPAGSGKTTLLADRFLTLLAAVDDPSEIVAITFTNAAAAEMRHRILAELEKAERAMASKAAEGETASATAVAAYMHAAEREWKILDQPARLRITTIDSFCRELALQQPLLSSFGGELHTNPHPDELYRNAARRTLMQLDNGEPRLRQAICDLLNWRDNNWSDLEGQLVEILAKRDKWLRHFVVAPNLDDTELRLWLERPFEDALRNSLMQINTTLAGHEEKLAHSIQMARYGFEQSGAKKLHQELAELVEFPILNPASRKSLAEYRAALLGLAQLLLTDTGTYREKIDATLGFPAANKPKQQQMIALKEAFKSIEGLDQQLHQLRALPPSHYSEEDWRIIRACFTVLRHAAGELKTVFAESGMVDFVEVAGLAQGVLSAGMNATGEAAFAVAEGIRHILVDEFQDTSRVQHKLLGSIVREWPEREGRTAFVVGDPMQSIYFFRNAEAELFHRTREHGLDVPGEAPLNFTALKLNSNFRTLPLLVERLNDVFRAISAVDDGSSFNFSPASPARVANEQISGDGLHLHLKFVPQSSQSKVTSAARDAALREREEARAEQIAEIVELCRSYTSEFKSANSAKKNFRVAILGRTKNALTPIAAALRDAGLSFRAVDLEPLSERPEVQDALALARALLNPEDRLSWLGVLRAPWCGLKLDELYQLVSEDDPHLLREPIPTLITERMYLLDEDAQQRLKRTLAAMEYARKSRAANPTSALGSWLEAVWLRLGGSACFGAAERVNLDLLWKALDTLPNNEEDLLGTALDTALKELKAQPDPGSSSTCGIQLMTLHKSKGLEFEVVIVPELQAGTRKSETRMLSWLERGKIGDDDSDSDEPTEFLVAPFQSKGKDKSPTQKWVDGLIRAREQQEMRRLFYVATTRARDELHLFARPAYKNDKKQGLILANPEESLLKTAWPAFTAEIQSEFDEWLQARESGQSGSADLDLAATGKVLPFTKSDSNSTNNVQPLLDDEGKRREPTVKVRLRRLPTGFAIAASEQADKSDSEISATTELYHRQQGGVESRLLGSTIHALLEKAAHLRTHLSAKEVAAALLAHRPRVLAAIRSAGITTPEAGRISDEAYKVALRAAEEPTGSWILAPHKNAASELRWTGLLNSELRHVQVDRLFQAGEEPFSTLTEGAQPVWWIIDYKSGLGTSGQAAENLTDSELPALRQFYAPQIETYARVLRELHGEAAHICGGIYYPRPGLLDWWKLER
jgi:ATP-dependent helicase/nuclease subunit A